MVPAKIVAVVGVGIKFLLDIQTTSLEKYLIDNSSKVGIYKGKFGETHKSELIAPYGSNNEKKWNDIFFNLLKPLQKDSSKSNELHSEFRKAK